MACGLVGKLPGKRDFIAVNAPAAFLKVYEAWLQGGLTASRLELAGGWQNAFLNAPIWRFWIGQAFCGQTVAGAFMPSVDGVGRYFPLTVFAVAETGGAIPHPELDPQDAWFSQIEDFLLRALAAPRPVARAERRLAGRSAGGDGAPARRQHRHGAQHCELSRAAGGAAGRGPCPRLCACDLLLDRGRR